MRLGGWFGANTLEELDGLCDRLDEHGLSAIHAPPQALEWSNQQCAEFGEHARELGIVIGEWGVWDNPMSEDAAYRDNLIDVLRRTLQKADAMGVGCVVTLVGHRNPSNHSDSPHGWMYSEQCRSEFRQIVLKILDGLDLKTARLAIEPWWNSFFYRPDSIREFIDSVDHARFGVHLDQMNMVDQQTYFKTTELIHQTFDLLADRAWSVHLKDVHWDPGFMFIKMDEVLVGDGVMDYDTLLKRLAKLPEDQPCYCEHLKSEEAYIENFKRVHERAEKAGVRFKRRGE